MHEAPTLSPRATRRDWLGLGVIGLPCVLYSMDMNVLHLAVPSLASDLMPSSSQLLWIMDIYGFVLASFLITMGALGDRIGRRRLLIIGATVFAAASILAAYSTSAGMLIFARALLGVAGATFAPSTLALLRNMFLDPQQRTLATAIWGSCFAAGSLLGPFIGGALIEQFWWGAAFLIAVPIIALTIVLVPWLLPEHRVHDSAPLDLASTGLATGSVLAIVYGVKRVVGVGIDAWGILAWITGCAAVVLFIRRQTLLKDPMLNLQLLRNPLVSTALAVNMLGVFASAGAFFLLTQYLQLVAKMSVLEAVVWVTPASMSYIVARLIAARTAHRFEPRTVLTTAFILAALGYTMLSQVSMIGGLWIVVVGLVLPNVGVALMMTITIDLLMSAVPPARAGEASGVSETSQDLGAALGIAVIGSLATAVYHGSLAGPHLQGIPEDVVSVARDTLGGAVVIAQSLDADARLVLLNAAENAFTASMRAAALASALLSAVGAAWCATFIKSRRFHVHNDGLKNLAE